MHVEHLLQTVFKCRQLIIYIIYTYDCQLLAHFQSNNLERAVILSVVEQVHAPTLCEHRALVRSVIF
jgi:hypothetical protein